MLTLLVTPVAYSLLMILALRASLRYSGVFAKKRRKSRGGAASVPDVTEAREMATAGAHIDSAKTEAQD
jgi:hypothetical protein